MGIRQKLSPEPDGVTSGSIMDHYTICDFNVTGPAPSAYRAIETRHAWHFVTRYQPPSESTG